MSTSIRKQLRHNPESLLESLTKDIHSPALLSKVRVEMNAISEVLAIEREKLAERQQLSRKIGLAKKANEDSSELVEAVSELSSEIDTLKQKIDDNLSAIQLEIAQNSAIFDNSQTLKLPRHLHASPSSTDTPGSTDSTINHQPISPAEWQTFVDDHERSTIYHDPRWRIVIENYFRHDYYLVTCRDQQNKLTGILPIVHVNSRLFGSFSLSVPYFNYGGPLASHHNIEEALMRYAADLSASLNCQHMEVRETGPRENWQSTQRKVSMVLPLPATNEQLDKQLGSKLRAQVNKASSNHLKVEFGSHELLDNFYQVFARNMRDLGTPVYGKRLFSDILTQFSDEASIVVVKQHGTPLAAGFLLGHKDKLEIPWASSVRSKNHLGANMFMYREVLRHAITQNYEYFDFGRSTRDATTHKFKKQWGAEEHPLHWHYWTRDAEETPELNPDNPKFRLAIMIWRRLPVFVTKIIGPPLARNLP